MLQQRALRVLLLEIRIGQDGAADGFTKVRGELCHVVGHDLARTDAHQFVAQSALRVVKQVRDQLARAHVRVGQRRRLAHKGHAQHIAGAFFVQLGRIGHRAGRDDADHVALHQPLAQRRVGQLLAHGHLVALFNQA